MARWMRWSIALIFWSLVTGHWSLVTIPAMADDKNAQDALQKRIDDLEALVKQQQATIEELKKQKSSSEENAALKKRIDDLENVVKKLQEVIELLQKTKSEEKPAEPQPEQPAAPAAPAATTNPDISVIGDFFVNGARGRGRPALTFEGKNRINFRKFEMSVSSAVDPFGRFDGVLDIGEEGVALEEATFTMTDPTVLKLPSWLKVKLGRFRVPFGKLNTVHIPNEGPQADVPLAVTNFLGEEGWMSNGALFSALIPNKANKFIEFTAGVMNSDSESSFVAGSGRTAFLGQLTTFLDLTDKSNLDLGLTGVFGKNDTGHGTNLLDAHAVYRWRPPQQKLYKGFTWWNEYFLSNRREEASSVRSNGLFSFIEYQLGRGYSLGARYDRSALPTDASMRESAFSLLFNFFPSDFTRYRLQLQRRNLPGGMPVNQIMLQATFSIGTHRPHPF